MTMKLHLYKYNCEQCGNKFKAPEISFDSYGEFLLRNSSGEIKYVNAILDPVYDEVSTILKLMSTNQGKSEIELAEIQRMVFGASCDVNKGESEYRLNAKPVCPTCRSQEMSYWEATEPPEYIEQELNTVTHNKWNSLSAIDKETRIIKAFSG